MKCECGCGQETTVYRGRSARFINGHNTRGRKLSETHRRKIGAASKGRSLGRRLSDVTKIKISEANKGRQFALGYKHTEETKKRLSEACSGENSPNWKGGISFEPYCSKFNYKFKESVRDKFDRKCFLCGKSEDLNGRKLDVHHVNYDKECLCSEVECEFVPLCKSCHAYTSNGDRAEWENKIIAKLEE